MPKRVIDFDAMWGSDKLASCAEWAQAEYAWLYGLADASGCFELTNLRVIWGRVAAIRRNLTIERLEQVFGEFQDKGLLFVWEHEGKKYGSWTGSDVPGRLPPPSWRMRLERLAPPVPKPLLAEYVSRYARGRASLPGGFLAETRREEIHRGRGDSETDFNSRPEVMESLSDARGGAVHARTQGHLGALKDEVEEDQAQDWNWDWNLKRELEEKKKQVAVSCPETDEVKIRQQAAEPQTIFPNSDSHSDSSSKANAKAQSGTDSKPHLDSSSQGRSQTRNNREQILSNDRTKQPLKENLDIRAAAAHAAGTGWRQDKATLVARELYVGRGPVCGPVSVKPEALERIRQRNAAREGSRSP